MLDADTQHSATTDAAGAAISATTRETSDEAARRWVVDHADALWRFAMSRTRSAEAAEEIVQETILAAMQGYDAYAGRSRERTWLMGIAAHKIADHFRRRRRDARADLSDDAVCGCATCRGMFTPKGLWACGGKAWPDPRTSDAERAEQVEALRRCIDALPPGQGEAVWMRDVLEIPSKEVCKVLGLTETNLWTRMHRARVALRSCLEDKFGLRKGKIQ